MNSAELLRKISKKSGTPETESDIFFELFAKKISKVLKEDEAVRINDIGYFKIEEKHKNKVIVFSPLENFNENNLTFYLTDDFQLYSERVDSFFSMSLGKPELPLNQNIEFEFFVPAAGNELQSFLESKADDLLLESLIINVLPAPAGGSESDKMETFQTDELEESKSEQKENIDDKRETEKAEIQELRDNFHKEAPPSEIEREDYYAEKEYELNEEDYPEKFQRVESLSSKFSRVIGSFPDESKSKAFEVENKTEKEETDENGYSKVRFNRIKSADYKKEDIKATSAEEDIDEFFEDKTVDESVIAAGAVSVEKEKEFIKDDDKSQSPKSNWKIPVAAIVIMVLFISIFFIFKNFMGDKVNNSTQINDNMSKLKESDPEIISRSYEIPVNYPYSEENDLLFSAIDPDVLAIVPDENKKSLFTEATEPAADKSETATFNSSEEEGVNPKIKDPETAAPIPSENYQEVKDYIYFDGSRYFIQVSSWNLLAKAERHNSNLQKKGYDSSIEKLISPSGNIYYIVRIGSFETLSKAEVYLRKN